MNGLNIFFISFPYQALSGLGSPSGQVGLNLFHKVELKHPFISETVPSICH